jgi:hypothetical protein
MTKMRSSSVIIAMVLGIIAVAAKDTSSASFAYSTYNVHGTYRITFTGFVPSSGRLQSGVGIFVADGEGNLSGTEVFNSGGTVCRNVVVTGTYALVGNGTGELSADFTSSTPGCSGHFNSTLLVYAGGNRVRAVSSDPSFVTISEEWLRDAE